MVAFKYFKHPHDILTCFHVKEIWLLCRRRTAFLRAVAKIGINGEIATIRLIIKFSPISVFQNLWIISQILSLSSKKCEVAKSRLGVRTAIVFVFRLRKII